MPSNNGPICISVINMKGGVGKTTIAASLAQAAARRWSIAGSSGRVLAVDLDPQANLSQALMGETIYEQFMNDQSASIAEVFDDYMPPSSDSPSASALDTSTVERITSRPNLSVIPARFHFADRLNSNARPDPRCLARLIANQFQDRELVVIDCAPTESIFTQAAYHASRYVLVPVRPEFFATIGFPLLNNSLTDFRNRNAVHNIDVIGVVVNDATYQGNNAGGPERRASMREIKQEAQNNGWRVFGNEIAYSRGFPKLMRGDNRHLGNAESEINAFAYEFFGIPELGRLGLGRDA